MAHKIQVVPGMDPEDAMWLKVWTHVNPMNWHDMYDWLDENYHCTAVTNVRGFSLVFKTREDLTAFVLQWS